MEFDNIPLITVFYIFFTIAAIFETPAIAQESTSMSMTFEECLQTIQKTATQLGVAPVNIVDTTVMRIVRFETRDGSVLVTCSRPDQKMIMTVSKK